VVTGVSPTWCCRRPLCVAANGPILDALSGQLRAFRFAWSRSWPPMRLIGRAIWPWPLHLAVHGGGTRATVPRISWNQKDLERLAQDGGRHGQIGWP